MKPIFLFISFNIFCFLFCEAQIVSQPVKTTTAVRVDKAPKIDGVLDDEVWKNVPVAGVFTELRPVSGRVEKSNQKTEVKIIYDNTAIYVAARMYDSNPDSIARELAPRDQVGNADFFGIVFDTYRDKLNGNGFFVTAAGSQFDAKYSNSGNEDPQWNAVWQSEVKIDKEGWTAELKIPYSALRFSDKEVQIWGLNMIRKRQKAQQQLFWNPIDPNANGFINQGGELLGISNVKAPMRLSFSPYVSTYMNHYPYNQPGIKNTTGSFNGGMDIKYGINQSFTLDMTLIPDFGQVQSDKQVLNLSPFEVQYNENRQFFTEGTEMFSKGDLFYSRRIGANPAYLGSVQTSSGETVVDFPTESKLLNATKISGRTAGGLGIGFFNAVTNRMQATVEDALGNRRLVKTQPLTNYNILVLDQTLKNNSSLSFINTSVLRQGPAYNANVSALDFSLNDKKNVWNISGTGRLSHLTAGLDDEASTGYSYDLSAGKQSGKFVYNFTQRVANDQYNPNDLGIQSNNNYFNNIIFGEVNLYKGTKVYNRLSAFMRLRYSERYKPRAYQSVNFSSGMYMQFKNLWSMNWNIETEPEGNDFYEARNGMVFKKSAFTSGGMNLSSNYSKRYSAGVYSFFNKKQLFDGVGYDMGFYQNFRISNKFKISNELGYSPRYNYAGWVGKVNGQTIFSRFERQTIENSFDVNYTFNTKMNITLSARHYWSNRQNKDFYKLLADGHLEPISGVTNTYDRNFNTFNVDMNYTWRFAPGSELSVAWKKAALSSENELVKGYGQNLDHIFNAPQNNSLSLKVLYYLDYLQLRKK
ncbi:MAG TPA: DUF5916 domain-containing protein [Daejeonella sp.]|nr:DUF5916 domain-containing protein [Daejeonella sp.]